MKKTYQQPKAKYINFEYDTQIAAASYSCDQGWTKKTTDRPEMRTAFCDRCFSDLIWLDKVGG